MIVVQLVLVAAFFLLFFVAIRSRTALSVSASKKLFFLVFTALVIAAVLSPATVTWVANAIGVGRGTDLVLYVLAVSFGFYVVNDYLHGQQAQGQLHQLARRIAILEALERYGMERTSVRDRPVTAESPDDGNPDQPHA